MNTIKILIWVILYLIKNKGRFEINMQVFDFNSKYYVEIDNGDFYINTSIKQLLYDIYIYNN